MSVIDDDKYSDHRLKNVRMSQASWFHTFVDWIRLIGFCAVHIHVAVICLSNYKFSFIFFISVSFSFHWKYSWQFTSNNKEAIFNLTLARFSIIFYIFVFHIYTYTCIFWSTYSRSCHVNQCTLICWLFVTFRFQTPSEKSIYSRTRKIIFLQSGCSQLFAVMENERDEFYYNTAFLHWGNFRENITT